MKAKGYTKKHGGSGAYNLDRVYEKDGIFYVVEAKGGGGSLGGKNVTIKGETKFAQQGTREYLEKTILDLEKTDRKLSLSLRRATENNNIKYLYSQQKIKPDGSLGEFTVKEFNIN